MQTFTCSSHALNKEKKMEKSEFENKKVPRLVNILFFFVKFEWIIANQVAGAWTSALEIILNKLFECDKIYFSTSRFQKNKNETT